jgi:hypothetical protein
MFTTGRKMGGVGLGPLVRGSSDGEPRCYTDEEACLYVYDFHQLPET